MGVSCSRWTLVIINSVFALLGLCLIILACLLKFGSNMVENYFKDKLTGTLNFINSSGSRGDMATFDLGEYLGIVVYVMIAIGVLILVISLCGCCGSIGKIRYVLIGVRDVIREPLLKSLREEYRGINGTDVITTGWNFFMIVFKCCGVDDYQDFQSASKWQRSLAPHIASAEGNNQGTQPLTTQLLTSPVACCKWMGVFPDVSLPMKNELTCALEPNIDNSNMYKGCLNAILDYVKENDLYISIGAAVLLVTELLMLIVDIRLLRALRDRKSSVTEISRMFIEE
ncbi:tetraspanin-18-like [Physella acuta]|uniref:tetraspanin-18-like n=1 Tax=Physella acuta TaxID=109671 RepID=UPI0027DB5D14|nr:tetraspanin-18-like [Physella acuta]